MGRPFLIAAEGLDRAGTTGVLDLLGRWFEREGLRVRTVRWTPSGTVRTLASKRRGRADLTPRVAALLAAAEAMDGPIRGVRRGLSRRDGVLVDRYAWTAIARESARGLPRQWLADLYAMAPRPDLILYCRQRPARALSLAAKSASFDDRLAHVGPTFKQFLRRVTDTLDDLARTAGDARARPWPAPLAVLDADVTARTGFLRAREAARPLLRSGRAIAGTPTEEPPGRTRVGPTGDRRGALIVLEGIDHAGRSTHARLLEQGLRYRGTGVVRTSFGGSVVTGEVLRRTKAQRGADPHALFLLYVADLAERLEQVIDPALRAGLVVIADRWTYTAVARAAAWGIDAGWARRVLAFAPRPDLVVLLDVVPTTALARATAPGHAKRRGYLAFLTSIAAGLEAGIDDAPLVRVDAGRDAEDVAPEVDAAVQDVLADGTAAGAGQRVALATAVRRRPGRAAIVQESA